jgi:heat shock protein HslJ
MQLHLSLLVALTIVTGSCGSGETSNNLPGRAEGADTTATGGSMDAPGSQSNPINPAPADTGTLAGSWFLVAILPSDTAAGKVPNITFDLNAKTFTGHTGCNTMRGKFSGTDSTLQIDGQIITTKMACAGYNEDAFLKNLPKVNGFRFENGMLVLVDGTTELSRWTRQPVKPTNRTT